MIKIKFTIYNISVLSELNQKKNICLSKKFYFSKNKKNYLKLFIEKNIVYFFLNILFSQQKNELIENNKKKITKSELIIFNYLSNLIFKVFNLFFFKNFVKNNQKDDIQKKNNYINCNFIVKFFIKTQQKKFFFFSILSFNNTESFNFNINKKNIFSKKKIFFLTSPILNKNLQKIFLKLRVLLILKNIFLYKIANWKINDIFLIKKIDVVTIYVKNVKILLAKYGIYKSYRAIKIIHFLKNKNNNFFFKEKPNMNQPSIMKKKIEHEMISNNSNLKSISNDQNNVINKDVNNSLKNSQQKKDKLLKDFKNINIISQIPVTITVELGHKNITIKELLSLSSGSIISLKEKEGEHLNILVNGNLIAKGELVMIQKKYGIRITSIIADPK
ncbi:flagellar motor switch protein FliN [Buchnera aphidicola]|nr:flagellar motor switch protein FliN [Buchnera aphidicola]